MVNWGQSACVFLPLSLFLSLFLPLSPSFPVSLSLSLSLSPPPSLSLYLSPSLSLSLSLSLYMSPLRLPSEKCGVVNEQYIMYASCVSYSVIHVCTCRRYVTTYYH